MFINRIDSVIRVNKKYYPQKLLEECKYIQEKINKELENSESDSDSNNEIESDIDNDDE